MLERLIQLTNDVSPEGRRQLLYAVTDLFLVDSAPSSTAQEDYAHIASRSLDDMSGGDRSAYAERIAAEPTLPRAVAKKLAADPDAAVASVVLKLSPVLTDADLAAIALSHSQEHLIAIAERATLSESVTDVLVERGDTAVLRTVSGNDGAQLSERGITQLVERGATDPQVSRNLVQRARKFPPAQAKRVLQIVSQVASQAAARPGAESVPVAPAPIQRKAQERRLEVKLLINEIKSGKRVIGDVVKLLAKEDRAFDLAQVIGTFAEIPNAQVLKAMLEPDASAIAVACRTVGVASDAFKAILELRSSRLSTSPKQLERDLENYEDLPQDVSEHTMRFLKVRSKVG